MFDSFPLCILTVTVVFLLAFFLQKIISKAFANKIKRKYSVLLIISFFLVWSIISGLLIISAGLSHSAKTIELVPARCSLLFIILLGLPLVSLLLLHYRNYLKAFDLLKIKTLSILVLSVLILFIFYLSEKSGIGPPLAFSCKYNLGFISSLLIKMGANVNDKDVYGNNPIMYTAQNGDLTTTELLLETGTDLNKWGIKSLYEASINGQKEIVELLVNRGIDVNSIVYDYPKWTVLMAASDAGQFDIVKILVQKGASLDMCDKDGKTAMMIAKEKNRIRVYNFLKSQKLDD